MQGWRAALAALSLSALVGAGFAAASDRGAADAELRLLRLLGLERRPRPDAARVAVPDAMRALYDRFAADLPFRADTVRSFTHRESSVDDRFEGHHKFRLAFDLTVPEDETLSGAELVVARDAVDNGTDARHRVFVYDIVRPGVRGRSRPALRLLDRKWARVDRGGSLRLDVSGAAERWLRRPRDNHGLLVRVQAARGGEPAARHVRLRRAGDDPSWRSRQPALLAYTADRRLRAPVAAPPAAAPSRAPRAARRPPRRKNGHDLCQRRPLRVDFQDVGWSDWIVAPTGYDAYYCHGDCPFPLADHLNSTNHAIVQTLVNSVSAAAMPKACCVPTELSTVSLLYTDDGKVVLKHYRDMTVVGCGCR